MVIPKLFLGDFNWVRDYKQLFEIWTFDTVEKQLEKDLSLVDVVTGDFFFLKERSKYFTLTFF